MTAADETIGQQSAASSTSNRRYGARLATIKKRAEFQRLRGGVRWSGPCFVLEGKPRAAGPVPNPNPTPRFGFTITKKIGKAHERNRMRRRLSHALRTVDIPAALIAWDMVIVARPATLDRDFALLVSDFRLAIARLAKGAQSQDHTAARGKPARNGP